MTSAASPVLVDGLDRPLREVRISVTDRCNFRCTYCMPRSRFGPGHAFLPRSQIMTVAEIIRLARILVRLGVRKVRLTGGEPLLRPDLEEIIEGICSAGALDVALTSNGALLAPRAQRLKDAGLHRLTVSLDTLDPQLHRGISDSGVALQTVLSGLSAARAAGFGPIKLNAVIRRGLNVTSILPLVEFAREHGDIMRFIEFMDVGESNGWKRSEVVGGAEILAVIAARHPLEPIADGTVGQVARRHRFLDGRGEIGVITSVTEPFCGGCTRLRLSADGRFHTCLFATAGNDVLSLLRTGSDDAAIAAFISRLWVVRTDRYSEERATAERRDPRLEMSYIGG
ncbi:MAG: GTP 3',8-cyclase MoaA [Candidatus Dormibacteraeota bacterium]|uniref:GTP 3',8-cyclase n=1 Tax=Candidatus Aeolococcus gillhamiae TaxID=3127015 RepID=A0A2W5ZHY8_9BACT|nr:GTP 3',8-cyclase MoaA [Candidatus Dormibacteraeota bacterium]PZR82446.1 MAG: GTP 3',8-cyclase MoaA [Candidatus Dormibacter sp. RRmetagenome_bin12]